MAVTNFSPGNNIKIWIHGNQSTTTVYNSSGTFLGSIALKNTVYVELGYDGIYYVTNELMIKRSGTPATSGTFYINPGTLKVTLGDTKNIIGTRGVAGSCSYSGKYIQIQDLSDEWTDFTSSPPDYMYIGRYGGNGAYSSDTLYFSWNVTTKDSSKSDRTSTITLAGTFSNLTRTYAFGSEGSEGGKITNPYGSSFTVPSIPSKSSTTGSKTIKLYLKNQDGTLYDTKTSSSSYTISYTGDYWYESKAGNIYPGTTEQLWYNATFSSVYSPHEGDLEKITFPLPTMVDKTGYTYKGWYTAASGGTNVGNSYTTNAESSTLYAQYEANTYTVSYDTKGGTAIEGTTSVTYNAAYGTLKTTSRIGYTFMGWYDLDGSVTGNWGNLITSSSIFTKTADQVLYARWGDPTPNTLSFNLNGGSWTPEEEASFSKTFTVEGSNFTIPKPHKADSSYKFIGWKTTTANWKILDPNTSYTKDSYVMDINIIPSQVTTWDKTLSFTAYYQQLGKYTRVGGKWHPILKTFVKRNGSWIKTEDVLDPTIGIGKTKMKVNNHWTGEIGSDTK